MDEKPVRKKYTLSPEAKAKANRLSREYYYANRERMIAAAVEWQKQNPERRKKSRQDAKDRLLATPVGKLSHGVSTLIRRSLEKKGYRKKSRTREILGCDLDDFRSHIERQFLPGMSWKKVGPEIHLDHIVPVSTAKTEEEVLQLNHFTNFRPMWAGDNIRKGAKMTHLI